MMQRPSFMKDDEDELGSISFRRQTAKVLAGKRCEVQTHSQY